MKSKKIKIDSDSNEFEYAGRKWNQYNMGYDFLTTVERKGRKRDSKKIIDLFIKK